MVADSLLRQTVPPWEVLPPPEPSTLQLSPFNFSSEPLFLFSPVINLEVSSNGKSLPIDSNLSPPTIFQSNQDYVPNQLVLRQR